MLRNDEMIAEALRALGAEPVGMPGQREAEARVLAAFDARMRRRKLRAWMPAVWLAAAASLSVVALRQDMKPAVKEEAEFVAIPYTVAPAPYERTSTVRMQISVAGLLAAGFHVPAVDAGEEVTADVLLGQDGRAVAIRVLSD